MRSRQLWLSVGTVLVFFAVGFSIYGSSLHNELLTYDDDLFVTKHPLVTSGTWADVPQIFSGFDAELYMPLTILSLKVDYMIGGTQGYVFHLSSLLFHILGSCLLAWLFALIFKNKLVAIFLGMLFLVHPLNTEVVAWVSARKDVLSTPLFLGAAIAYIYALDTQRRLYLWVAACLFAASLFAKYMTVSLPALLVIVELLRGHRLNAALLRRLAPFVLIAAVFTVVAALGKQTGLGVPFVDLALMAGKTTLWYLRSFVFPADLRILYLQEQPIAWTAEFVVPWLLIGLVVIGCLLFYKRGPGVVLGLGFFFASLAPTFAAALKYGVYFAADHYAYLPMIGVLLALGWALRNVQLTRRASVDLTGMACVLLLAQLSVQAHAQAATWEDGNTVFTRALAYHPCAIVALNNRAAWHASNKDTTSAKKDFQAAIACDPTQARLRMNYGMFLDSIGEADAALQELNVALNIAPLSAETHFALGVFFQKHGRMSDAKAAIENAITLDPNYVERKMRNTAM